MERQYIVSERAHLMCPAMQFGLCVGIRERYEARRVGETLEALQSAHPFLRAVVAREEETGKYYYDIRDALPLQPLEKQDVSRLYDDYRALNANGWNAMEEGLLRVAVYPEEQGFHLLLVAHHLLCDGRGLLGLAMEFADAYCGAHAPEYAEEQLLRTLDDLSKGSGLPFVSRCVVQSANRAWAKEKRAVSYPEYLAFEKKYLLESPLSFQEETVSAEETARLVSLCREHSVTVNDYLVADRMRRENTTKVIVAADLRGSVARYRPGAMGNYATAFSVVCKEKCGDTFALAKDVARQMRKKTARNSEKMLVLACYFAMTPELLDAAAISALGGFQSKAGAFVGGGMFGFQKRAGYSVTNLGRVENPNLTDAVFIPPASPANRKTTGVVTVNGVMRACSASAGESCQSERESKEEPWT